MERYFRQMILPEVGSNGQAMLTRASVLVVGAGGLGCPLLQYLVAAGVGRVIIADSDRVDRSNLHRQPLFGDATIGALKVQAARERLHDLNPHVQVVAIPERVTVDNILDLMDEVDVVADCSDNFATKYLLNDGCVERGRPLVLASVYQFEGQLSVFNARTDSASRGPTYRCLFPHPPHAALVPSCEDAGVLGVLPGVLGTLQAVEVIKLILGVGEPLVGRMLRFDALTMAFSDLRFERNPAIAGATRVRGREYYESLAPTCSRPEIPTLSVVELREALSRGEKLVLIDVRGPEERSEGDLTAPAIPAAALRERRDEIPRDRAVVLFCRSGARSSQCVTILQEEFGYTNVRSLEGGMLAWHG